MIPGSNIFRQATRLIGTTTIMYEQFQSRSLNAARQWVATYSLPMPIQASVQAVDRNSYIQYGLDFQKNYIRIYTAEDVIDIERDSSGDRISWNGKLYQIETQNTWFAQDGWASVMAVEVDKRIAVAP